MTNQNIEIQNINDLKSKLGISNLPTNIEIQRPFSLTNQELESYKTQIQAMTNDTDKIAKLQEIINAKSQIITTTQRSLKDLARELGIDQTKLKDKVLTPDTFKIILDSLEKIKNEPEKRVLLLSAIFSVLNQFGVSIDSIRNNKITLKAGKETQNKKIIKANDVITFTNILNTYIGTSISIDEIQKALLYRTSAIDDYISSKTDSNGILKDNLSIDEYVLRLLAKYNITKDGNTPFTKESLNSLTEEEHKKFKANLNYLIVDNQADKEFLIAYFDNLFFDKGSIIGKDNFINDYFDNKAKNKPILDGLKLLNTLDDATKYALGLRNSNALKEKSTKLINDPIGLLSDSIKNEGGILGVLLGILYGIFGSEWSIFWRFLAGFGIGVGAGAVGLDNIDSLVRSGVSLSAEGVSLSAEGANLRYNWSKEKLQSLGNLSQRVYEKIQFWYEFRNVKIDDGTGQKDLLDSKFYILHDKANNNIGEFKKDGQELSQEEKLKLREKLNEYMNNLTNKYPDKPPNKLKAEFKDKTLKDIIVIIYNTPNTPRDTSQQTPTNTSQKKRFDPV